MTVMMQMVTYELFQTFFFFLPISTGGGEMISEVFLDHSTFADPPSRLVDLFKY